MPACSLPFLCSSLCCRWMVVVWLIVWLWWLLPQLSPMDGPDIHWPANLWTLVFESPVFRPEKDRKKTRPGPVFWKTAVLVFRILKQKTAKRPVYMDRLRPVKTGLLCPSITPSNVAQEYVNWLKTDWDIQHFVKCSITTRYFIDIFISSSVLAHFGRLRARFGT